MALQEVLGCNFRHLWHPTSFGLKKMLVNQTLEIVITEKGATKTPRLILTINKTTQWEINRFTHFAITRYPSLIQGFCSRFQTARNSPPTPDGLALRGGELRATGEAGGRAVPRELRTGGGASGLMGRAGFLAPNSVRRMIGVLFRKAFSPFVFLLEELRAALKRMQLGRSVESMNVDGGWAATLGRLRPSQEINSTLHLLQDPCKTTPTPR